MNQQGRMVVIYGANNLGKSAQVLRLTEHFITKGLNFMKVKYPIYTLQPTGPKINKILREPKERKDVNELDLQTMYAQNRRDFEPTLTNILKAGINIIAEDYIGTGIAWGLTYDLRLTDLETINKDLLEPDIAILLDGERFKAAIENGHKNEDISEDLWEKARENHLFLAKRYKWNIVNANQTIDEVHKDILDIIEKILPSDQ